MKVNINRQTVTKGKIFLILLLEAAVLLAISSAIAAFAKALPLAWLMFFPLLEILSPQFRRIYKKCDKLLPLVKSCKTNLPFDILANNQSTSQYFKILHSSAQSSAENFLCLLKPKAAKSKSALQLYADISSFCKILSQVGIFRVFTSALILGVKHRSVIICVAIFAAVFPNFYSIKSAVFSFVTLPQRAAVIFDAILRAFCGIFLPKGFGHRLTRKNRPSYFHSDIFVRISAYFWSLCFSMMMIFSENNILALSGLAFMLSPYCLIYCST